MCPRGLHLCLLICKLGDISWSSITPRVLTDTDIGGHKSVNNEVWPGHVNKKRALRLKADDCSLHAIETAARGISSALYAIYSGIVDILTLNILKLKDQTLKHSKVNKSILY